MAPVHFVLSVLSVKTDKTEIRENGRRAVPAQMRSDSKIGSLNARESEFVERFGLMYERLGANRSVGRALAWLMICEPPEQSAEDIREALQLSQASVSNIMRTLQTLHMVERISIPGQRRIHYRVPDNAWETMTRSRLREFDDFVGATELGLKVMAGKPAASRRRIEALSEWTTWWRARYLQLIEEWEKR